MKASLKKMMRYVADFAILLIVKIKAYARAMRSSPLDVKLDIRRDTQSEEHGLYESLSFDDVSPRETVVLKKRITRRRHRNSRLGCDECKRRRIKCDETLPECNNCKNRHNKGPSQCCSYLSMTEEELDSFRIKKQRIRLMNSAANCKDNGLRANDVGYEIKMIPHKKIELPVSAWTCVKGLESFRIPRVAYLQHLMIVSLDWQISSKFFITLAIYDLINTLNIRIARSGENEDEINVQDLLRKRALLQKVVLKYRGEALAHAREIISMFLMSKMAIRNEYVGKQLLFANQALQYFQVYADKHYDGNHYTAMIDMCLEMYKNNAPDKIVTTVQYYWSAMRSHLSLLYYPSYSTDLLYEICDVLKDLEPYIVGAEDKLLRFHYQEVRSFVQDLMALLPFGTGVLSLSVDTMYGLFRRWMLAIPPEAFCLARSAPGVRRVFYTFYHSIPAYLNNLLTSGCYVLARSFYGSTSLYPFDFDVIFENLEESLGPFAEYSIRLLSFMERRRHVMQNFFTIENPFPDDLHKYRFESRQAVNIKEKHIRSLRNELITWDHYPDIVQFADQTPKSPHGRVFMATECPLARNQLQKWREVKNKLTVDFISPAEPPKIQVAGRDFDLLDRYCYHSVDPGDMLVASGEIAYTNSSGLRMSSRGLFVEDCDISQFFDSKTPPFFSVFLTLEDAQRYRADRICLLSSYQDNSTVRDNEI